MAEAGAVGDVVGPHDAADALLQDVAVLIRRFGRSEGREAAAGAGEGLGNGAQGLIPAHGNGPGRVSWARPSIEIAPICWTSSQAIAQRPQRIQSAMFSRKNGLLSSRYPRCVGFAAAGSMP